MSAKGFVKRVLGAILYCVLLCIISLLVLLALLIEGGVKLVKKIAADFDFTDSNIYLLVWLMVPGRMPMIIAQSDNTEDSENPADSLEEVPMEPVPSEENLVVAAAEAIIAEHAKYHRGLR